MSIHTKHSGRDCEVCAAQQEADAVGAIPTAGHRSNSDEIGARAEGVARAVQRMTGAPDSSAGELWRTLIQFAEEIKRQAVEP